MTRHIGLNKPEYNLMTQDVHGAAPNCVKFKTKRIGHDPLNPNYQLSHVEKRPVTPPKFIKDSMAIDYEGAGPKKDLWAHIKTRESNKIHDIEGTKAEWRHKPRNRSPGYDAYDYSDITKATF